MYLSLCVDGCEGVINERNCSNLSFFFFFYSKFPLDAPNCVLLTPMFIALLHRDAASLEN